VTLFFAFVEWRVPAVSERSASVENGASGGENGSQSDSASSGSAEDVSAPSIATPLLLPSPTSTPLPPIDPWLVGILPGHWEYDSGAVCSDGLTEVEITTDVAQRVQALLEYRGFRVELLPEQDPDNAMAPIVGYRAGALISIHADSCDVPGASGFKAARWRSSPKPDVDDRLVGCVEDGYETATLLRRHPESVTIDMWNYYAFREIDPETPAALIELGFLLDDRVLLDDHRYEMALGIANGLSCFLGAPPTATPELAVEGTPAP
jgi:N-acetylmuramoyl-L-alanine amidase